MHRHHNHNKHTKQSALVQHQWIEREREKTETKLTHKFVFLQHPIYSQTQLGCLLEGMLLAEHTILIDMSVLPPFP